MQKIEEVPGHFGGMKAGQILGCNTPAMIKLYGSINDRWVRACDAGIVSADDCRCKKTQSQRLTVELVAPQGCGKSKHGLMLAQALGCSHVLDDGGINGESSPNPDLLPKRGALVLSNKYLGEPDADLVILAKTQAAFDRVVELSRKLTSAQRDDPHTR